MISGLFGRGVWLFVAGFAALCPPAHADSFGPWQFSAPDGYEHEVTTFGMTYKGPLAAFIFGLPVDMKGARLTDFAPKLVEEATGATPAQQQFMRSDDLGEGRNMALYMANAQAVPQIVAVFESNGQAGVAIMIAGRADEIEDEMTAFLETEFQTVAPAPALQPSHLPAIDWPAPLTEPIATTRPVISAYAATQRGIDTEHVPIPGDFECFREDGPRAMVATPDLAFSFADNGTYRVTNGLRTGGGGWRMQADDTFDYVIKVDGTMAFDDYFVMNDSYGLGQSFHTEDPFVDEEAEVLCHQSGPAVEAVQQDMARVAISQGMFSCTDTANAPFRFFFGNGVYKTPEGQGRLQTRLDGDGEDYWEVKFDFLSGPYAFFEGEMTDDDLGGLQLTVQTSWSEGSMFYTSTETTVHAICRMGMPKRPLPVYGQDPAPAASSPEGGLPEGLFQSFENHPYWSSNMYMPNYRETLTWVAPGGYMYRDVEMDDLGDVPDCTKSRPDGFAYCGEYQLGGGMIAMADSGVKTRAEWDEPLPFSLTDAGFVIDGIAYTPVEPMDEDALEGVWVADSYTGSGPAGLYGVGVYNDADVYWKFGGDGRFEWRENVTSQTLITADPILGGVSGGGSSSSSDGGVGKYAFDGSWLTLNFDDGRQRRMFVLREKPGEDEPAKEPNIILGGTNLKRG